jgi:tellurite resistance protein
MRAAVVVAGIQREVEPEEQAVLAAALTAQ